MTINFYHYTGEADKAAMSALVAAFPAGNLHVVDLPYRFSSWALDERENIGLWRDEDDKLAAWAVLQTPFWSLDYVCHPNAETQTHRAILNWADAHARQVLDQPSGRPLWFVNVFADQHERMHDLEAAGFANLADAGDNSWSKVLLARPAGLAISAPSLPAGFTVRRLAGENEVAAYVALHRAVFESKSMTVEWRRRTLQHPAYRPDLDLVVAAPDGQLAAFCIGWFMQSPQQEALGQIEPLGVAAAYQQLGLGRAILDENIRRLRGLGAKTVYVETDNYRNAAMHLYEAAGFALLHKVWVYRKEYGPLGTGY